MSTSVPNYKPIHELAYVHTFIFMHEDSYVRLSVRMPCLLYEALYLAALPSAMPIREEAPHLIGLWDLFDLSSSILWVGHQGLNLSNVVCTSTTVADDCSDPERFGAALGATEDNEEPYWVADITDVRSRSWRIPFFGPVGGRTIKADGALVENTGDLLMYRGLGFSQTLVRGILFSKIDFHTFSELQKGPADEDLGD